MTTYKKYQQKQMDLSMIGLENGSSDSDYFCTPKGAEVIGQVGVDDSHRSHCVRKAAGREIVISKKFTWGGDDWYIPSVYSCTEGLIMDICVEIDPKRIKTFIDEFGASYQENLLNAEESQQLYQENPLSIDYDISLKINHKNLHRHHGSSMSWIPESCLGEGEENSPEIKLILQHYGLDPSRGWYLSRESFSWATVGEPVIKSLVMKLKQCPLSIPGIHFNSLPTGKSITFMNPVTGTEHTLTVLNYEKQEITQPQFGNDTYEYPTHYGVMTYTLSPDMLRQEISVIDCCEGDRPCYRKTDSETIEDTGSAASYAIIGGACSPVAILLSDNADDSRHMACSSLHFAPVEDVEWRIEFHHKTLDDIEVNLLDS